MSRTRSKSKRPEAERASEWVLRHEFHCLHTRRALRTKFAKVDFFGCDTIGVLANGEKLWVQVTAGAAQAVSQRRKKLEAYPWHASDRVMVWQLVSTEHPVRARVLLWHFRVWEYSAGAGPGRSWCLWPDALPIRDRSWFTAWGEDKEKPAPDNESGLFELPPSELVSPD